MLTLWNIVFLLQYSCYVRELWWKYHIMLLQPLPPFESDHTANKIEFRHWCFCVVLQWVQIINPPKSTHSFPISFAISLSYCPFLALFPNGYNPNHFLQICSSKQFTKPPSPVGLIWGLWKWGLKSVRRISGGVRRCYEWWSTWCRWCRYGQ